MRAYYHFRTYEVRDAAGQSAADRSREVYGVDPPPLDHHLPRELCEAETVAIIYDEIDGFNFLTNFDRVEAAFAKPDLAADREHREAVLGYLEDATISPRLIRRLAERDAECASRVFQSVLKQPRFSWERDGEALLRRYKASYFDQPVLPSVTPLSERLSRAQIAEKAGGLAVGHRPGRNEPCPCGSGRKYKHCCGR